MEFENVRWPVMLAPGFIVRPERHRGREVPLRAGANTPPVRRIRMTGQRSVAPEVARWVETYGHEPPPVGVLTGPRICAPPPVEHWPGDRPVPDLAPGLLRVAVYEHSG